MDLADELRGISLCSGGAGLDLGVELAIGPARVVCYVEREVWAISYLAEAMEAGWLAPAPVWTDLRTFDGRPWRGRVHYLAAGYPCQPFSLAGSRGGASDPRHLWPRVRRAISQVQPGIVFLENVPGHVSLGFEKVMSDLRRLGYRATAGLYSAAEVGASHRRERLFILGLADPLGLDRPGRRDARDVAGPARVAEGVGEQRQRGGYAVDDRGRDVANRLGPRLEGRPGEPGDARPELATAQRGGDTLVNPPLDGRREGRAQHELRGGRDSAAGAGGVIPLFPPGPADLDRWAEVLASDPRLAPAQSKVRLLAHGVAADRSRWLRLLGNGVVPLAAANAFCSLFAALRAGERKPVQRGLFE